MVLPFENIFLFILIPKNSGVIKYSETSSQNVYRPEKNHNECVDFIGFKIQSSQDLNSEGEREIYGKRSYDVHCEEAQLTTFSANEDVRLDAENYN